MLLDDDNQGLNFAVAEVLKSSIVNFANDLINIDDMTRSVLNKEEQDFFSTLSAADRLRFVKTCAAELRIIASSQDNVPGSAQRIKVLFAVLTIIHGAGVLGSMSSSIRSRIGALNIWRDVRIWVSFLQSNLGRDIAMVHEYHRAQNKGKSASVLKDTTCRNSLLFDTLGEDEMKVLIAISSSHAVASFMRCLHLPSDLLKEFLTLVAGQMGCYAANFDITQSIEGNLAWSLLHRIIEKGIDRRIALNDDLGDEACCKHVEVGFSPLIELLNINCRDSIEFKNPHTNKTMESQYQRRKTAERNQCVCVSCRHNFRDATWKLLGDFLSDDIAADTNSLIPSIICETCFRVLFFSNHLHTSYDDIHEVGYCPFPSDVLVLCSDSNKEKSETFQSLWSKSKEEDVITFNSKIRLLSSHISRMVTASHDHRTTAAAAAALLNNQQVVSDRAAEFIERPPVHIIRSSYSTEVVEAEPTIIAEQQQQQHRNRYHTLNDKEFSKFLDIMNHGIVALRVAKQPPQPAKKNDKVPSSYVPCVLFFHQQIKSTNRSARDHLLPTHCCWYDIPNHHQGRNDDTDQDQDPGRDRYRDTNLQISYSLTDEQIQQCLAEHDVRGYSNSNSTSHSSNSSSSCGSMEFGDITDIRKGSQGSLAGCVRVLSRDKVSLVVRALHDESSFELFLNGLVDCVGSLRS